MKPMTHFKNFENIVSIETLKAVKEMGFTNLTEIQAKCIPLLLKGKDVKGKAKTGSGKTLAFLIPAIELMDNLKYNHTHGTGVIIISPTRELAMQSFCVLRDLMQDHTQTYAICMGGSNYIEEKDKVAKGVNILLTTPGRLLDHLTKNPKFIIKNLKVLIIDEADRILDIGFENEMKKIFELLPKKRQTMLFCATNDQKVKEMEKFAFSSSYFSIDVDATKKQATVEGLKQAYVICPTEKRLSMLFNFVKKCKRKKVMIFFSSRNEVEFYNTLFNYVGVPVLGIHGQQKQFRRTDTFFQFCNAESGILLCTNVAARGWDIPAVDCIVQYDPPDDTKEYIHRVGRTARAGREGQALMVLREEEMKFVDHLKQNKVDVDNLDIAWNKLPNLQEKILKLISGNLILRQKASLAYTGYLRAYHSHKEKKIFDIKKLDFQKTAMSFGLLKTPKVSFGTARLPQQKSFKEKKMVSKIKSSKKKIKTESKKVKLKKKKK